MGWLDLFQTNHLNNSTSATQQTGESQATASSQYAVRQQLQKLAPGDIISGKVTETSGDQVKLLVNLLQGDAEVEAKLSQSMALNMGKNLVFQVKSNGNGLMLSPLFENMGMEENGKKALSMAGIPENERSLLLVSSMMKEGISIDKNTVSEYYHQAVQHKDADLMNIIDLHRMQLPVTKENLEQIASYKNMTHQLSGAIDDMAQELPGALQQMMESGKEGEALKLFTELVKEYGTRVELAGEDTAVDEVPTEKTLTENSLEEEGPLAQARDMDENGDMATRKLPQEQGNGQNGVVESTGGEKSPVNVLANQMNDKSQETPENGISGQQNTKAVLMQMVKDLTEQWQKGISGEEHTTKVLRELLDRSEGRELLQKMFSENLKIKPEETDREGVKKLFQSMDKQLQSLSQTLNEANLGESNLGKMVQTTQQNLDFLEQVNQMYAYMQLPIKLTGQDTNSDLYVYTNKKNLSSADGEISAFLHLDMQNLGPVDCLVKMQDQKVSTKFTLQDDEMLDFLQSHIGLLTERLEKRGYNLSVKMDTRDQDGQDETNGVFRELIVRQSNIPGASTMSFDVRT